MSGDYDWDNREHVSFIEDEPEEIMGTNEQAFGYGAGYADATRKAQVKIDALVAALKSAQHALACMKRGEPCNTINVEDFIRTTLQEDA